jgi:DNA-binding CsgD family transcriptional regulator
MTRVNLSVDAGAGRAYNWPMDARLSALIALSAALIGFAELVLVALFGDREGNAGSRDMLPALACLEAITIAALLRADSPAFAAWSGGLTVVASAGRLGIAAGWVRFCHRHMALNGGSDRPRLTAFVAALAAAALAWLLADQFYDLPVPGEEVVGVTAAVSLIYAALSGVFFPWRRPFRLASTRAGVTLAMASLMIYPLLAAADLFGFRFLGLDPAAPVWQQTQGAYHLLAGLILAPYFLGDFRRGATAAAPAADAAPAVGAVSAAVPVPPGGAADRPDPARYCLTEREAEVTAHIVAGKSYKEIADAMGISLATVKTHVNRAYDKLGVRGRSELQARRW